MTRKKKSKKAPLRGNRYGYGRGLSASDQRRQKRAFKRNVKKYKQGDKSAFEPTEVDKEVMADRKAGRRPEAPESKYNDSMETPKLKVRIFSEGDEDKHQLVPMHFKPENEEDHPHYHPHFDPVKGMGAVGYNGEIHAGARGFIRHMKPSEFLATAEHLDTPRPGSREHIVKHLKSGGRLGNPFLSVEWNKHSNSFDTVGHEGRHRMMAYKDVHGDKPVPVHINVHKHRPHNTPEDKWREMSKAEINPEGAIPAKAPDNDLDAMLSKMKTDMAFDRLTPGEPRSSEHDDYPGAPSVQDVLNLLNKKSESMKIPKLKVSILNEDWKKAIAKKAKASGKSAAVLRKVYKRGLAAYASGHRPGMSQHAWAMARVNSYLRGGPARKVDSDIKEGVEHGTQFKMVHVGSDQEGRKTYKLHAHCDHDGHAGHVKFSMHKGHTYIHAMEIRDSLKRQGYGPAMMNEIYRMHDESPDQHGKIHYAGHHEDNAQTPMPEALSPGGLRDRLTKSVATSRRAGGALEKAVHAKHPGTAADYYLGSSGGSGLGADDDADAEISDQVAQRRDRLDFVKSNQHKRGSVVQRVFGAPGRPTRLSKKGTDDTSRAPSYDLGHRTRFGTGGLRAKGGLLHNVRNLLVGDSDPGKRIHVGPLRHSYSHPDMGEALNIEDIPAAGEDLARIQQGKKPLRGVRAKIVDMGRAVKKGAKRVMRVIRGDADEQPILIRKESVEKSGERFSGVNKPKRTPGASKKFAVLAKEGGKTRIVRFGDPNMKIKKHIKGRRKNFRARHGCDKGKLSKLTARYWSCRKW